MEERLYLLFATLVLANDAIAINHPISRSVG